jgi:pyrroline-5-carboxylate reductase
VIVGLIGAGNMAGALARGWAAAESGPDDLLLSDVDTTRARSVAEAVGGKQVGSSELAEGADLVVLCVKPSALDTVARDVRVTVSDRGLPVASVLGATTTVRIEDAFGAGTPVLRFMPNVAAEVRMGTFCYASGSNVDPSIERDVLDLFGLLGDVVRVDEPLMEAATALSGCGPAFLALVVEALVDAGVRHGLTSSQAAELVISTMAGTAALLEAQGGDTAGVRRKVTSPGGVTAAGLAALEDRGLRAALASGVDAVVTRAREAAAGDSR